MIDNPVPTSQTIRLSNELKKLEIEHRVEYPDGHKHVDIAIPYARIYIEIDGLYHYINAEQIKKDFKRNHFSDGDDFDTIHIPNELIEKHAPEIAKAIAEVVKERIKK